MRLSVAAAVMIGFCGTAFAGCPVADIEKALNLPIDGLSMSEQDVEDIQSTAGGPNGTLKRTTEYFYFAAASCMCRRSSSLPLMSKNMPRPAKRRGALCWAARKSRKKPRG
jgi:hypothetical protein